MHVGIVGSGQLARMLALAGWPMDVTFSFLAEENENSIGVDGLGDVVRRTDSASVSQIFAAMGRPDVITVEREHVDTDLLTGLAEHCPVRPGAKAVHACQHRLREKELISSLQLDTAPYRHANDTDEVRAAAADLGLPLVIKNCAEGYDGKGQWHIRAAQQLEEFCASSTEGDWLVESMIAFDREISIIAARSANGEIAMYPPTENLHEQGVLITSMAPASDISDALDKACHHYVHSLLEALDYVGVMAMECFVKGDRLMINELAPRVHNSGHWTINSHVTSQFENHLRAILGLRLGNTATDHYAGMINILGHHDEARELQLLSAESALHLYNKTDAPRRKLGHINVTTTSRDSLRAELERLHHALYEDAD
tara:strand:+ start:81864 stop:82976 length:1113 start_codon:yes stop_codon:yes gene_type:complete